MKGNVALAEAAVRAGCRFFAGYPITPQTEIMEYLSSRMAEAGGAFIQSESEVSAVNMLYGASTSGYRVMTSTSGPGFSLMQAGISYLASMNMPAVIADICRYGSGIGLISPGQSDYLQVTKGGGHGDYKLLVYAPHTVQESVDLIGLAFDKAEEYMNPVIMLSDGAIGQMMEGVELPEFSKVDPDKPWVLKGADAEHARNLYTGSFDGPENDQKLRAKYELMAGNEQRWEAINTQDAEIVLVSYGISSRVCKRAVKLGREQGIKLGLLRPITLWPFPVLPFKELRETARAFLSVEMSAVGQLIEDVALSVKGMKPVYALPTGMTPPKEKQVLEMALSILDGKEKEVF